MARCPFSRNIAKVHVSTLLSTNDIAVKWLEGRDWFWLASASHTAWRVEIPRPTSPKRYLVALHEIGHLLGPIAPGHRTENPDWTPGQFTLIEEAAAWAWAAEHIHDAIDMSLTEAHYRSVVGEGFTKHTFAVSVRAAGME